MTNLSEVRFEADADGHPGPTGLTRTVLADLSGQASAGGASLTAVPYATTSLRDWVISLQSKRSPTTASAPASRAMSTTLAIGVLAGVGQHRGVALDDARVAQVRPQLAGARDDGDDRAEDLGRLAAGHDVHGQTGIPKRRSVGRGGGGRRPLLLPAVLAVALLGRLAVALRLAVRLLRAGRTGCWGWPYGFGWRPGCP